MVAPSSAAAAAASLVTAAKGSSFLRQGLPMVTRAAENPAAPVGRWMFGTAGLVVTMIHVGGVTRLTQSGLSMTTWTALGSLPPLTKEAWEAEFARYKSFPEWQQRRSMTLSEFKFIYGWEYGHRMLGRFVGIAFCIPWMYFTARGRIPSGFQGRMAGLLAMGGTQGLVGWWMVQSGLGEDRRGDRKEIRVRPARLASHLSMALATYGALLWTGWDLFGLPNGDIKQQVARLGGGAILQASRLRIGGLALTGLTAVTVVSGALVAGNDAGRAYNTFPTMDGEWIPSDILELVPMHRNLVENTATVQWNHRVLGGVTALAAASLGAVGLRRPALITPQVRNGLRAVVVATAGQFALGVATLLNYVPITLAAAHQLGSVAVFTGGLYLVHSLRYVRPSVLRGAAARHLSPAAGHNTGVIAKAGQTHTTHVALSPLVREKDRL